MINRGIILFFLLFNRVLHGAYEEQPSIKIRRGHMVLTAARDKNISLETSGYGGVHLNGEDVFHIFNLVKTTAQSMHTFASSGGKYDTSRLAEFEEILKRINTIEGNTQNVSMIAANRQMIYRLNRRLISIQRNVRKVMTLLNYDECQTNPCLNGGTCQDLFNAYLCLCPGQWEGSTCNIDVDECARFAGTDLGCQNGATCINKRGGYECVCAPGWVGLHCTRRTVDCNSAGRELCDHGTCITAANTFGYKCFCDEGWTTDSKNPACSVDVDECGSKKLPCSTNPIVPCINVPGSFYCGNCPPGYTGNGYYCTDVDECALFNGGCSMNPMVQCINTLGSRSCGPCPPGYLGNGLICSYQGGVCAVNNGGCHPLAQCRDNSQISSSYVECICPRGYAGSGFGSTGCARTEHKNPCETNPCIHGNCSVNTYNNDYICECGTKFTGRNCDVMKDPCNPNPCLNNGSCTLFLDISYRCKCPDRYFGYNCENAKQVCGDTMEGYEGTFEYPVGKYVNYNNCVWRIKTKPGNLLKLAFTEFNFEDSQQCQASSLTILDSVSQVIRKMCGRTLVNITSPNNEVQLWLQLNNSAYISRFKLNWSSTVPSCGGTINATSHGTIKSPGSPSNYPPNIDCYWTVQTALNKLIIFHFYSLIIGNNSNCEKDYLEFYSDSIKSKPFAKYCNTSNPEPLHSETSNVIVHFHSDSTESYPGFQMVYSLISGIPGCGGVYIQDSGSISSPNNLPSDVTCEYKIKLPSDAKIKIEFLNFDVGPPDCSLAHLAIYEGSSVNSPLIGKYCGTMIPAPYISLSNEILIFYKSGSSKGFTLRYSSVCREKFTNNSGIIQSTNYPQLTFAELTCTYEIIQTQGTTITLNIIDLTMHSNHSRNYLEVSDGGYDKREHMDRYTSQSYPLQIISKFNYLRITVKQSSEFAAKYYFTYTTTDTRCGGLLTSSEMAQIQTPPFSTMYSDALKCTWFILAPKNHVIMLIWSNFNVLNCTHSRVTVYNVEERRDDLIGAYCNPNPPPTVISSNDILKVTYSKQRETAFVPEANADSFLATFDFVYAPSVCGGDYFTSSGIIKTPEYSSTFQYVTCEWKIKVPPGVQIMLMVRNNTLQNNSTSCNEYLEIRNGASPKSPLIGKYCNELKPPSITSHANALYLKTRTRVTKANGITISWESAATGCGGILTSYEGVIASPNYPGEPPQLMECYWKVTVNAGSVLQFQFNDLDVQSSTCLDNYIEIIDGPFFNSPTLGKFCSKYHSASINTTSENAVVKFVTNNTLNGRGFLLKYTQVCNVSFERPYGVIESPNFPNPYQFGVDCTWNIVAPKGNTINITFTDFDLRLGSKSNDTTLENCLKVEYTDPSSLDLQSQEFCDENPQFLSVKSNKAQIHFASKENHGNTGFRLEWVVAGCLETLTHPRGEIKSPNYPNPYPASTECEWLIQADYGSRVVIEFEELDVDIISSNCFTDFIKIYNGPNKLYPVLSTMCHTEKSTVLTSSGNSMLVTFESNESFEGRGFKANYSFITTTCGGLLRAKNGSFHSPNYPKNFNPGDNCEWLIEVEESYAIELNFIDVDLINNCTDYYIKVYDGPSSTSSQLAKICNDSGFYNTIQSTYNYLFVEMRTGQAGASKGFIARFNTRCGATLNKASGLINNQISRNLCQWTITAERPDQHASVTFTAFEQMSCENDLKISVYNGLSDSSPLIGSYCGKIPPTITSTGSALHIVARNGFRASYTTFGSGCGGTLQNEKGYFTSPGYPGDYPTNTECEWIIAASNSITITFSMFDLVESEHCNEDFLEFRERDYAGKLLGNFCGSNAPTNLTHIGPLWVMFKSSKLEMNSGVNTARGFMAEYSLSSKTELVGPSGQIQSPLYPYFFATGRKYYWRIIVDFRHKISLKLIDLDFSFDNVQCVDLLTPLKIYDGYDETAPELCTICNKYSPKVYETVSNVVFITCCESDVLKVKFVLSWEQIELALPTVAPPVQEAGCGSSEIIDMNSTPNYTFTSPGYPHGYSYSLNCTWQFITAPEQHLSVLFTDMDLYNYGTSCYDAVKVYNRNELNDWDYVRSFCLSNETFYEQEVSNSIKLEFTTGYGVNQTGFSAVVYSKCGGNIKNAFGVIKLDKPMYTRNESISCQWNITARPGRMIEIKFHKLNWSDLRKTCHNYIFLRNGQYADSPLLGQGKYCLDNLPSVLRTTGYHLYIMLVLENKVIASTVLLEYKEVTTDCKNKIALTKDLNTTTISSPNYPNIPTPHSECTWVITAPQGESLSVDFIEQFDLVDGNNCVSEYVEIREGATMGSPLKGRWCGDNTPNTQVLYNNVIFVKYFTDVQNPRNGFKATVSLAECGGKIYSPTGELKSSDYMKQSIKKSADCTWRIIGPIGHALTLTFTSLNFGQYNCTNNYVNVYRLDSYCSKIPLPLFIPRNYAIVTYKTENQHATSFALKFSTSHETCGESLENEIGYIFSPRYFFLSSTHKYCKWTITVPKGRRIKISVLSFHFFSRLPSHKQELAFYDGDQHIVTLHAGDNVKLINSTENKMTITFKNEASIAGAFALVYTSNEPSLCEGDLNENSGVITAPRGRPVFSCTWTRSKNPPANQTLSININATVSSVQQINVTAGSKDKLLTNIWTNLTTVRTPYLITEVAVAKSEEQSPLNFTASYKTYPCGGIISDSSGSIVSPRGASFECVWLINPPEGQNIKVDFTFMDLGDDCDSNYIAIRNGMFQSDPKIGTYCARSPPENLLSQSNALWIEYRSFNSTSNKGFNLTFESITSGCGGILHDVTQLIQTPSYPSDYPNNAECVWELHAYDGYHISLEFVDRFHLEMSTGCKSDFVQIWDYVDDDWVSVQKLCGRERPNALNSTSNKLKIMFRSNEITSGSGFKATWNLECGGNLVAEEKIKYITSPGYPLSYENNLNCVYNISALEKNIHIVFLDFNLEQSIACRYDNLSINSDYMQYPMTAKTYCGNKLPNPLIIFQSIFLTLRTDSFRTKTGFKFSYQVYDCGGNITKPTVLVSPVIVQRRLYVHEYVVCQWNITAPQNQVAVIRFESFTLLYDSYCSTNQVGLYEGFNTTLDNRLVLLCGNLTNNLPIIKSQGNKMALQYGSYPQVTPSSFKAIIYFTYGPSVGCGGNISLTNESSYILKGPKGLSFVDCHWQIQAMDGFVLKLTFLEKITCTKTNSTKTHNVKTCKCSQFEVRDGGGSFSQLISEICDDNPSTTYTTSSSRAWIRWTTNGFTGDKFFRLQISAIPTICGETNLNATVSAQYITSPNYPQRYPANTKCIWSIKGENYGYMYLRFIEFDLGYEKSPRTCENDRLEVGDKSNTMGFSESLGSNAIYSLQGMTELYEYSNQQVGVHQYCGTTTKEFEYYSQQNEVVVTFHSGTGNHGQGFKLQYEIIGCSRNYTTVQGRLLAGTYPYPNNCTINIVSPENTTIALYFNSFYIAVSGSDVCGTNAKLEIFDGNTTKSPALGVFCGYDVPNPVFTTQNKMLFHLVNTDSSYFNYDITFVSTSEGRGCGGTIYNYRGVFASPMYPNNYRNESKCTWEIYVPSNFNSALKFKTFNLLSPCKTDYVIVTTYEEDQGNEHRYCTNDNPPILYSSNRITVTYKTSVHNGGSGWMAQFTALTDGYVLKW